MALGLGYRFQITNNINLTNNESMSKMKSDGLLSSFQPKKNPDY